MTPESEWQMIKETLLREMNKDIFTVASPGRVRLDQTGLEAAEEVLSGPDAIQEDFAPIFMDYGHYGSDTDGPPDHDTSSWSPLDDVEEDPEESLSSDYVSRKRTEESRLRNTVPYRATKSRPHRSKQLHAALADDGALDQPTYTYEAKSTMSKYPFTESQLSENKVLRKFSRSVSDQELTWHRDREDRIVRVVEGMGWSIQLDNELPRPMRLGETYEIPAGHWHRLVRRDDATNLCVIIKELKKGDRVKHKGKKATVKVPDARGPLVGIDPDGPKDMEMVPDDEIKPVKEAKKKGLWANVHAKRKRGGKPAKPGDKNYPDEKSLKAAQGKG